MVSNMQKLDIHMKMVAKVSISMLLGSVFIGKEYPDSRVALNILMESGTCPRQNDGSSTISLCSLFEERPPEHQCIFRQRNLYPMHLR